MQMCPTNRKYVLMYRDMKIKIDYNENVTLQRLSAAATVADNLRAKKGSFFQRQKMRKKTWTDLKK